MTGETWFFLLTHVKNYRSADLSACNQFISDPFPWKRTGLGRVGLKGKGSGQRRVAKVRAAEGQGHKHPSGLRLGIQRPSGPRAKSIKSPPSGEMESFVLRTYTVDGIGEKSYVLING